MRGEAFLGLETSRDTAVFTLTCDIRLWNHAVLDKACHMPT